MQAVVQVPLQRPGKLEVIDITLMHWRVIGVKAEVPVFQLDYQLDGAVLFAWAGLSGVSTHLC